MKQVWKSHNPLELRRTEGSYGGRHIWQGARSGRMVRGLWRLGTAALCALFAVGILTGCHGRESLEEFVIPEEFDTSREYEITFWAKNDTNKTQTDIYHQAIQAFEKLYPNITVNLRLYTDYGKIYNDVITNIATNTTPNVCITYPDHIATYLTGVNLVVPLEDLFSHEQYGLGGSGLQFASPSAEERSEERFSRNAETDG